MSMLWTFDEMVAATGGRYFGAVPQGVSGISIDTRTLGPGDAFFAIKGERFDGHNFATAAMAAGASLLVVAEARLPALGRLAVPKLVVPDVLEALEKLGHAARERASKAKIIAVTGSVGKTSTKEMLRRVLEPAGRVHAADRSFNNHWGVPLTLARMPADCDFGIFEIGMNHPGEIRPLVEMVRPHIAVVTNIAAAHLGFFSSLDEIAHAKGEIFEGVEEGGYALINRDDKRWKTLSKLASDAGIENIWGFGENARAQVKLARCDLEANSSTFAARVAGEELIVRLRAPGRHMVLNALAVIGAAHLAGANLAKVSMALEQVLPEPGRGRRHRLKLSDGAFTLIDESFNANPASMVAALQVLEKSELTGRGRRIAVLGDMLELGSDSQKLHEALAEPIAAAHPDMVFLSGGEMKALANKLPKEIFVEHRERPEELQQLVLGIVRAGDAVMIKSSKSIGFSKIVDAFLKIYPAAPTGD